MLEPWIRAPPSTQLDMYEGRRCAGRPADSRRCVIACSNHCGGWPGEPEQEMCPDRGYYAERAASSRCANQRAIPATHVHAKRHDPVALRRRAELRVEKA